jgi:hypothetical protein
MQWSSGSSGCSGGLPVGSASLEIGAQGGALVHHKEPLLTIIDVQLQEILEVVRYSCLIHVVVIIGELIYEVYGGSVAG